MSEIKKFIVTFENIEYHDYIFEAKNEEEARQKADDAYIELTLCGMDFKIRDGNFEIIDVNEVTNKHIRLV